MKCEAIFMPVFMPEQQEHRTCLVGLALKNIARKIALVHDVG